MGSRQSVASSLAELAAHFLRHLADVKDYSPATTAAYEADLRQLDAWLTGSGLPDSPVELQPRHFHEYAAHLADRYASSTIRRKLDAVSSFYRHLVNIGLVQVNPLAVVPRPRRDHKIADIPTVDDCRHLLKACHTPRERAIFLLLMTTGVRKSELLGADCPDLAPDFGAIKVLGKGRRQRVIPLPPITREALRTYLADRPECSGPLILNNAGRRLGATSLRRLFARVVDRAGFSGRRWTPHTMRHLFATRMLRGGCGLPELRELLGHSSTDAVITYLHADPTLKAGAVARWAIELTGDARGTASPVVPDARGEVA